ncbi:MAG: hypothetical protein ACSLEN_08290 [Candidatus Malihini olakiniferum]
MGDNKWIVNVQDSSVTGSTFTEIALEFTKSSALKSQTPATDPNAATGASAIPLPSLNSSLSSTFTLDFAGSV